MIIATTASAQSEVRLRVGMTLKEIRDEVPEAIERDKGHGNHLVQETDDEIVVYFFDDDGVCNVQVYVYSIEGIPEVVKTLKSTKDMVMISDREFMYYNEQGALRYTIQVNEESFFLYVEKM